MSQIGGESDSLLVSKKCDDASENSYSPNRRVSFTEFDMVGSVFTKRLALGGSTEGVCCGGVKWVT